MNNHSSPTMNERWIIFGCFVVIFTIVGCPAAVFAQEKCVPVDIPAIEADAIIGGGPQGVVGRVAPAGDVDNDGVEDFIIGAAEYDSPEGQIDIGRAYVRSGATLQILLVFTGDDEGDRMGADVAAAGDINGDGFDDVLVSAPGAFVDGGESGIVYVFSGYNGIQLRTYTEDQQLGVRLANVGDFNGDGFDDHGMKSGGNTVYVYSGASGLLLFEETGIDFFGKSFSGAGDVNNDGFSDLIVGNHKADSPFSDSGAAFVYSGQTGKLLYEFGGDNANDQFGTAVGGVGDIDGDGFDDVASAARHSSVGGPASGYVHFFSGQTGNIIFSYFGESGDELASQLKSIGDITGDGVSDILIAAGKGVFAGSSAGEVIIISGRTHALLRTVTGEDPDDSFAESVAVLDLNSDQINDLVIAADEIDPDGLAYVFYLPSEGLFEPFDLDQSGVVGTGDLLMLFSQWGESKSCADFDYDGNVGTNDLLILLSNWG